MIEIVFDLLLEEVQRQQREQESYLAQIRLAQKEAEALEMRIEKERIRAQQAELQRQAEEKLQKEKEELEALSREQNRIALALTALPTELMRIHYSADWGVELERRLTDIANRVGITQQECLSKVAVVSAQGYIIELFSSDFVPQADSFPLVLAVGRVTLPVQVMGPTHRSLLNLVQRDAARNVPRCWNHEDKRILCPLEEGCGEFSLVCAYLTVTLGYAPLILSVERVQNKTVAQSFRDTGDLTLMFHGTRSQQNEKGVLDAGFQVSKCMSGGKGYGTWFAYAASYSDSGFVYMESNGVKHIFLCLVTKEKMVLNNQTMRVVGQNCAYPQWLIKYRTPQASNASQY